MIRRHGDGCRTGTAREHLNEGFLARQAIENGKLRRQIIARPRPRAAVDRDAKAVGRIEVDLGNRRHNVGTRRVPVEIADMRLVHHMVPFAAGHRVIVIIAQVVVAVKAAAHLVRFRACAGAPLFGEAGVPRRRDIHLGQVRTGAHGIEDELVKGVTLVGSQRLVDRISAAFELTPRVANALRLAIVFKAITVGLELFGLSPGIVFGVAGGKQRDLRGMLRSKLAFCPGVRPASDLVLSNVRRPPRHGEEELDRQFERLEIADIGDPDLVRAVAMGEIHLLPDLGQRVRIDPLV
ncbi:hypothetical protein D9M73_124480 [compost metagenome]